MAKLEGIIERCMRLTSGIFRRIISRRLGFVASEQICLLHFLGHLPFLGPLIFESKGYISPLGAARVALTIHYPLVFFPVYMLSRNFPLGMFKIGLLPPP